MDRDKILARLADLRQRVVAPWRRGETPLELRKALLEELIENTVPVAPGKRVLAFDRVRIELYPTDGENAWVLREALPTWRQEMLAAVSDRLREIGCSDQPVDLEIHLVETDTDTEPTSTQPASDQPASDQGGIATPNAGDDHGYDNSVPSEPSSEDAATVGAGESRASGGRYALYFERSGRGPSVADSARRDPTESAREREAGTTQAIATTHPMPGASGEPPESALPGLVLEVLRGKAERESYRFAQDKIFVGRTTDVLDAHGQLRRRNHLAFREDDEDSGTVSREHARIVFHPDSGDYWVVDERSAHGTRVFRNGRGLDVSPRDRRGVVLKAGDEIYFGRSIVRCTISNSTVSNGTVSNGTVSND